MEEKPAAVLKLIPQQPKEHEKDNHNHGSDIAAGGLGGPTAGGQVPGQASGCGTGSDWPDRR